MEFKRGVEMLRMQNKNEFDHAQDYVLLANAVNSMTGRANIEIYQRKAKTLAAVFFPARNAVAIVNQEPNLLRVLTFSFYRWIPSKTNFCC
jgi:hypothetical protein